MKDTSSHRNPLHPWPFSLTIQTHKLLPQDLASSSFRLSSSSLKAKLRPRHRTVRRRFFGFACATFGFACARRSRPLAPTPPTSSPLFLARRLPHMCLPAAREFSSPSWPARPRCTAWPPIRPRTNDSANRLNLHVKARADLPPN